MLILNLLNLIQYQHFSTSLLLNTLFSKDYRISQIKFGTQ